MISLIAAIDKNGLIGIDGFMPWYNKKDLQWFKLFTDGKDIVMGRKTWESINCKPLSNRNNIVLSKGIIKNDHDNVYVYDNIDEILEYFMNPVFIGGASIYKQSMDLVDEMYITFIDDEFSVNDCLTETYFPEIDKKIWKKEFFLKLDEKSFVFRYTRKTLT